ncbi:MAG: archaemetzincin family Zn-dependent metalloprotease [Ignavibacteria bacterium]|jgi:archaemetzincin
MKINIAPLEFSNQDLLAKLKTTLTQVLKQEVDFIDLEIDLQKYYSSERGQYYSTKIIEDVSKITVQNDKIVILVNVDLYIPIFTFVFGEAQLNGNISIVSICRLHEEFYDLKPNQELLFRRTLKEVIHELGHNFGLIHCKDWNCVMHSSMGVEEVDIKSYEFCKTCRSNL